MLPARGAGGPFRAQHRRLTALMVRRSGLPSHTVAPFAQESYSGAAAIPKAAAVGATAAPPHRQTLSRYLWAWLTLADQGRRGTFTGQCGQPLCPGETATHPDGPQRQTVPCAAKESRWTPKCFSRLGSLALRRGRNADPPELSLPGPFAIAHCWPTLAAYLSSRRVRARISARARPRTGRIRSIGVGSIAPFMTEPTTPAAHA
jgi:hypothetical protein